MLKIVFGEVENSIYHPPTYFDNQYEDEWITNPLSVAMIKDIDKSEVIGPHLIESPVLGPISIKELSGGVKSLILMAFDESGYIFSASSCGENCVKWIVEIAKRKDLTVNFKYLVDMYYAGDFEAYIVNTDKFVHGYEEYYNESVKIEGIG